MNKQATRQHTATIGGLVVQDLGPSTSYAAAPPLALHEKLDLVTTELEKMQAQLHLVTSVLPLHEHLHLSDTAVICMKFCLLD